MIRSIFTRLLGMLAAAIVAVAVLRAVQVPPRWWFRERPWYRPGAAAEQAVVFISWVLAVPVGAAFTG